MAERNPETVEEAVSMLRDKFRQGEIGREEFERKMQKLAEMDDGGGTSTGNSSSTNAETDAARIDVESDILPALESLSFPTGPSGLLEAVNERGSGGARRLRAYVVNVVPPAVFATGIGLFAFSLTNGSVNRPSSLVPTTVVFIVALILGSKWVEGDGPADGQPSA